MRGAKNAERSRSFARANDAQSATVGFVIIMGIMLSATAVYFSIQIPERTKDFEFEHQSEVLQDFAELSAAIDMAIVSEDPTAFSSSAIGMAPERVQLVGLFATGGTLRFQPGNETFACIASVPNATAMSGNDSWNSTAASFPDYDTYRVETSPDGARLALEKKESRTYDSGDSVYLDGEYWFHNFSVSNGTTLNTHWLTVHASTITIGPNSAIVGDGGGLSGGKLIYESPYSDPGKGKGGGVIPACRISGDNCFCGAGGGGAGHNSTGGKGGPAWTSSSKKYSGGEGGGSYGNATSSELIDCGSGGAMGACGQPVRIGGNSYVFEGGFGGDGGGVIHLHAQTINVSGTVSVNGEDGRYSKDEDRAWDSAGGGGGGGSGGTILLMGNHLILQGNLSACGGKGANGALACDHPPTGVFDSNGGGGGGGAGGRIKIFYGSNLSAPGGLATHTNVSGGSGGKGGVGKSPGCAQPKTPKAGEDGDPGIAGSVYSNSSSFIEFIPHHPSGYLVSNVTALRGHIGFNASNTSMIRYGTVTWTETTPSGTNIALKVRTSMNANMSDALPWESCPEVTKGQDISDLPSVSDGHQYIQWRAELITLDRSRSPTLHAVNLSYDYGIPVLMNASGNIQFGSQYLYQPDSNLIYEHGGTIKNQSEGEFMLFPPPIIIARDGDGNTRLNIATIGLTGNESSVSGVFSSTLNAYYQSSAVQTGGLNFHNITLSLVTEHPAAWQKWFNKTCAAAGLAYGTDAGEYMIAGDGRPLQITFYGNESRPVNVWLKYSTAEVELQK
jgi:hypothetical protein